MPPRKITILGGGMGGLATAWRLTQEPNAAARYEITVYQRDWLLGGKGASGRNAALGQRIEEHGLHILMGFYDNALGLLKTCYDDLSASPPPAPYAALPWQGALTASDEIFLGDRLPNGDWSVWKIPFPDNTLKPGVDRGALGMGDLFEMAVGWMWEIFKMLDQAVLSAAAGVKGLADPFAVIRAVIHTMKIGAPLVGLEALMQQVWQQVQALVATNVEVRRLFIGFNFVAVNVYGMFREQLMGLKPVALRQALDRLDQQDYRAWFRSHQTAPIPAALGESSPLINAIYELVFARDHSFAAGSCLYDSLRMLLDYKGHLFYRMNAGMGDIVFAPLYFYLERRGVKFRFFHEVTRLHVGGGGAIDTIDITQHQPGLPNYDPLVPVKNLPCWPNAPKVGPGPVPPATLHLNRGSEFDDVVLAVSVAALPALCNELVNANPRFAAMLQNAETVRTRSVQVWLDQTATQLGWLGGPAMMGGYAPPLNAWADMSQTLAAELWPEPKSVAYFCDTILGVSDLMALPLVKAEAIAWINQHARNLFPHFDWARLVDRANGLGAARLDGQYLRANTDPSDHYVLTPAGSTQYRMGAADSGFPHLYLAGDWTRTPLNAGCLEAATMAGIAAGEAIINQP